LFCPPKRLGYFYSKLIANTTPKTIRAEKVGGLPSTAGAADFGESRGAKIEIYLLWLLAKVQYRRFQVANEIEPYRENNSCKIHTHMDWVNAVAVTPDSRRAVSASSDRTPAAVGPGKGPVDPDASVDCR
jgi:hypothetical protein